MKKVASTSLTTYIVILLISLFLIFFVGRELDPNTNTDKMIITSDGINHFSKGMDIAGGVSLTYKIDLSTYEQVYTDQQEYTQVTKGVEDIILQNVDKRVSSLGVSDYSSYIQTLDDGKYVVVEIGGISDLNQAKEIIGKTVELEFKLPYEGDGTDQEVSRKLFAEDLLKDLVNKPQILASVGVTNQAENVVYHSFSGVALESLPDFYKNNIDLLADRQIGSIIPTLTSGTYGNEVITIGGASQNTLVEGHVITKFNGSQETIDEDGNTIKTYSIEDLLIANIPAWELATDPKTGNLLNGAFFKYANIDSSQTGLPVAVINFDDKGKEIFCNITEQIVGKQLAIFIGGELVTSPVIREKICGGSAQIDGGFTPETAKALVDELNEGALPAPLILAQEEKVSPVLGEKALSGAILAAGVGLLLIYGFMIWMYGFRQGSVAVITLVSFIIVLLGITKLFKYSFSLSGIAAILLSLGMGVDANVLIYERIREERDQGSSWLHAIEQGYQKSYSAIRDGNVTTLMIAMLLFFMGTNVFKGFGTMMMVNIILTLLVIVPLTRRLLYKFYENE